MTRLRTRALILAVGLGMAIAISLLLAGYLPMLEHTCSSNREHKYGSPMVIFPENNGTHDATLEAIRGRFELEIAMSSGPKTVADFVYEVFSAMGLSFECEGELVARKDTITWAPMEGKARELLDTGGRRYGFTVRVYRTPRERPHEKPYVVRAEPDRR